MKGRKLLLLVVGLMVFSSLACVCIPTELIQKFLPKVVVTPTGAVEEMPPSEATPTEAAKPKPSPGKCFAEVPLYPRAKREAKLETEWQRLSKRFGPLATQIKGEVQVLTTPDPPAKVIKFYETEMPKRGWEKKFTLTTEERGLLAWEKGRLMATFLIGGEEKKTYIIIGCGPKKGFSSRLPYPVPNAWLA